MPGPFTRLGQDRLLPVLILALIVLAVLWVRLDQIPPPLPPQPPPPAPGQNQDQARPGPPRPAEVPPRPAPAEGYLFCHWNVENFYDDRDDPHNHDEDEDWFGRDPAAVREKVDLLADALLRQNQGQGPDILAMVEVESRRSVELLRDALNSRLPVDRQYRGILQRDYRLDRRLAPAVLTRLPVRDDLTRLVPNRRILEAHVEAEGAPLTILASHWTSRLRGGAATEFKREAYASAVYNAYLSLARDDPAADVILSGDFNDEPDDPSVRDDLHAVDDASIVLNDEGARRPRLLDLMMGRDPRVTGTYYYNGRWQILDHVLATPGLLDPPGWLLRPETVETENGNALRLGRTGRPRRFGSARNPNPRGPSDHFAVSVRLRVRPRTQ